MADSSWDEAGIGQPEYRKHGWIDNVSCCNSPSPVVVIALNSQSERATPVRYVIVWFALTLVGCESASSPPTSTQANFPAVADSLTSDDLRSGAETKITAKELDAVRRQIGKCWNVPHGAPNPEELVVELRLQVSRDRRVTDVVVLDSARMENDKYFRAMATSAVRAFQHPNCSRLKLPSDKYEKWKEMTVTFDPRLLFRGK